MTLRRLIPLDVTQDLWDDAIEGAFMASEAISLDGNPDFIGETLSTTLRRIFGFGPPAVESRKNGDITYSEYQFMAKDPEGNIFSLLLEITARRNRTSLVFTIWARDQYTLDQLLSEVKKRVEILFPDEKDDITDNLKVVEDDGDLKVYPPDPEGKTSSDKEMMELLTPNEDGREFLETRKKLDDLQRRWIEGMTTGNFNGVEFDLKSGMDIKKHRITGKDIKKDEESEE